MSANTGMSDQTKKVLIGVAAAATVAGVGYVAYKSLSSVDIEKELEEIKALGNMRFKEKQYGKAIEEFTRGIEKAGADTQRHIVAMLYQNRAACREKVGQNATEILNDCLAALKVDKKYAKAYLRAAKALNDIGKKQDALAYLLAAFTLDSNLNKANFEFFGTLLTIDPADCVIGKPEGIEKLSPQPVALYRVQQWCDTWDIVDLFKTDLTKYTPTDSENPEQRDYKLALDKFKEGKYERILDVLNDDTQYAPAMILRAKMLSYGVDPNEATRYVDKVGKTLEAKISEEDDEERKRLLEDAYDILKIELMYTMKDVDNFIRAVPEDNKDKIFKLSSFAAVFVYNGCVLDTAVGTHEEQMMADTNNASRLLELAEKNGTLTPHLQMINKFLKLCTCDEHGDIHRCIREMEELAEQRPTHFNLVLMAKVYMMTNNGESSAKLLNEAAKITTRYLVPSRCLQMADLHVHKKEEERLRFTTQSANDAIAVDPFNFSAHILHLLGTNGPEAYIKRDNYEKGMESIRRAALFAPPRELLMLKKMILMMKAKKRAAEMLDLY
uniref:TPR_REGION domain-containing protein n=1 Tax=Caenorhabditis japonica TaxID=281687 RepID=A0A8R1DVK0_CAEJA